MRINKIFCDNCKKEIEPRATDRIEVIDSGTFGISKYRTQGNGVIARAAELCPGCSVTIAALLLDSFKMRIEDETETKVAK